MAVSLSSLFPLLVRRASSACSGVITARNDRIVGVVYLIGAESTFLGYRVHLVGWFKIVRR